MRFPTFSVEWLETTNAILMRKNRFGETSLIVTWFSQEFGKIKTMVKGALNPKGKFRGFIDLFFECEIQFVRSAKSEIHILREASLLDSRENLRKDYPRVALAAYFVELLELVSEPDHPSPELYDLLQRGLSHLDEKSASLRALEHFELELSRLLGIQNPNLSPSAALIRVYHRLPPSRKKLLQLLKEDAPFREPNAG